MVLPLSLMSAVEAWVDPLAPDERDEEAELAAFLVEVLPEGRGAALEAEGAFPDSELRAFASRGLVRALVPEDQGGALDWGRAMRVCSRLSAHDLDVTLCLGGTVLGSIPLLVAGTEAQRAAYFGAMLRGEMGGLALSEWAHGSDLLAGECRAEARDGGFVLRGEKAPTNNGSRGEHLVVLARTSDGDDAFTHTLFLVGRSAEGLSSVPRFATLGHRSMDLSGPRFDGVRVGPDAVVGRAGEGFVVARRSLEISRAGVATMAVGAHAAALSLALGHARQRRLYGAPIAELGGVRRSLGAIAARAVASAALARFASRAIARFGTTARAWSSAAKLACPALLEASVHEAGTILGARSLMSELPMTRLRRSAPVLAIFDGSSQLQLDELWRHAGGWREAGEDEVRRALASLYAPARRPFVAEADDDGSLRATSPPAVLGALGGPELAPLASAARALARSAGALRGAPQELRFRASSAAATLATASALVASREVGARAPVDAATALFASLVAGDLAAALVELGEAQGDAELTALGASVLGLARGRRAHEARVLEAIGALS